MEKIKDIKITRFITGLDGQSALGGYIEISAKFIISLPSSLLSITNINEIAQSYAGFFGIDQVDESKVTLSAKVTTGIFNAEGTALIGVEDVKNLLLSEYAIYEQRLNSFSLFPFDTMIGKKLDGDTWI